MSFPSFTDRLPLLGADGRHTMNEGTKTEFRLVMASCSVVVGIGFLGMLGWLLGQRNLTSFGPDFIPMAPSTAMSFILLGGSILSSVQRSSRKSNRIFGTTALLVVGSFCLLEIAQFFGVGASFDIEGTLLPNLGAFGHVLAGRMSPITAVCFVFASGASGLLTPSGSYRDLARSAASIIGWILAVANIMFVLGYLYGAPLLYGGTIIPVALSTALAFEFVAVAIIIGSGTDKIPLKMFIGNSARSILLRTFVPLSILFVMGFDVFLSYSRSYIDIDPALLSAASTSMAVVITATFVFLIAQKIGSELDRAENDLRESEERFRAIFEQAAVGVAQVDSRTGRFIRINHRYCDMVGYTVDEMSNLTFQALTPPEDLDDSLDNMDLLIQGKIREFSVRKRYFHKNGSIVWAHLTVSPMWAVGAKPDYHIAVVQDITDLKLAEQEGEEIKRQLLQAQKMEAIGTLASGIAHDFNNLLQVVLGYSEMLLAMKNEGDPDYPDIYKIYEAGKKGADLAQGLLVFSRKSEPKLCPCDLNHEIIQVRGFLSRTIPKIINIDLQLSENLDPIQADPSQMVQVLMNLAVNARDAMPDGGTLTIETANIELTEEYCRIHLGVKPGPHVLLTVADSGVGMDEQTLERIYEPFFSTKEVGKGTGLGLSTVYGIIKKHNGHLRCYSELGHGTTFKIYFPTVETNKCVETKETEAAATVGTEKILLVDDDDAVRELGARLLKDAGYTVFTVSNGKEALEMYANGGEEIALVILDLIMPEMDGRLCLAELLRLDPKGKVLIASGFSQTGLVHEVLDLGAGGFVEKPYDKGQLLNSVRKVLDGDWKQATAKQCNGV
ncbi:MAG: PAS domain S-box protein [Desulfomonilaceae bacterium]|jgi:PAS domain S-box-containing protein